MDQNPYAAPQADVAAPALTAARLTLLQMFFSFRGRIRRGQYWACVLGVWLAFMVLIGIAGAAFGLAGSAVESESNPVLTAIVMVLYAPLLWVSTALQAKRWHDRGKSAWWMLLALIPLANIWVAIEVGFLAGTPGTNDYGPPPP